ncbi:MAG: ABC transporter ATP-binding protein [Myxococcota bacterium]
MVAARNEDRQPSRSSLIRLLAYARPFAALILLAVALTAALGAGRYTRAYLMKPVLDDVLLPQQALATSATAPDGLRRLGAEDPESGAPAGAVDPQEQRAALARHIEASLYQLAVAALALIVALPLLLLARSYTVEWVLGRVHIDIMRDVCAKLLALPLGFHHGRSRGDAVARTLLDVEVSNRAVKLLFGDLVESVLMIAIGGVFLFTISWRLALISMLIGPALFGVIAAFSRRIKGSARRRQEKAGDVTTRLMEILAGIKVIKAFGAEAQEDDAFRRETGKLFCRGMRVTRHRVLARGLVEMLNNAVAIGMLLLGVTFVLNGRFGLTPGDLAAFALVLSTTYRPVRSLAKGWVQLMDAEPSADRFFAILDTAEDASREGAGARITGVRHGIEFRDVCFSYGREPVLEDVSFRIATGEVVALVGRTGAGKTSVADLLMRFHDPEAGSIAIDGQDLRRIDRDALLAQVAVVTQEPFLFDASIRDNIRYGRVDASGGEILAAARAAHVDEFALALPEGYDTEVGAAGVRLSGGQRQRITIARALLRNPAILIFDEATSALDAKSEALVQDAIESLLGGRTVLLIAHRLATLRRADRIVVLESGRVSQAGTHDELLRTDGLYRELFDLEAVSPPFH